MIGAAQEQGTDRDGHKADRGHSPSSSQRLNGLASSRGADQDHQQRDPDDGAELAAAAHHRRRGRVAAALGDPGQGGAAEQRQRGAHAESLQYLSGQPVGEEVRMRPDALQVPHQAAGPDQRADEDDQAVSAAVGDLAEHRGDDGRDERRRCDRKARLEQVVAPHIVQEQHVSQQVGVEAGARDDGQRIADDERLDAQVCGLDQRRRTGIGS